MMEVPTWMPKLRRGREEDNELKFSKSMKLEDDSSHKGHWVQTGYLPFVPLVHTSPPHSVPWEWKPMDKINRFPCFLVLVGFGLRGLSADLREGGRVPGLQVSALQCGLLYTSLSFWVPGLLFLVPSG